MNKRTIRETSTQATTGRIDEACSRYGLGRRSMRETAEKAGAIVKLGRVLLIHYGKVDKYLESLASTQA